MIKVQDIQMAIEALPPQEYVRLRQWFSERDWKQWDRQIKTDSASGRLDFLLKEAAADKAGGHLRDL